MGNNAKKKEAALVHNKMMKERKLAHEAEKLDRLENPDKYRSSKKALHHARMIMAISAGFNDYPFDG